MSGTQTVDASQQRLLKWPGALAVTGLLYFFVSLAALHVLRTDYDPTAETVSQYAIGPYGYLMTTAFFALGFGVLALAFGLFQSVIPPSRIGSLLLGSAGVSVLLVAIFPIDQGPGAMPIKEFVHNAAFMASFCATLVAMFALTTHFMGDERWRTLQSYSLVLTLVAAVGFVVFIITSDTPWRGLVQRVCIVDIFLWLLLAAIRLRSLATGLVSTQGASRTGIFETERA